MEAFSDDLEGLKKKLASTESTLKVKAEALSKKRHGVIPKFEKTLAAMAVDLGMPNVQLKAVLKKAATFHSTGNDDIEFLFTANPKMPLVDISKAASGGELSRIMLCLKSMVATNRQIPVLIFDEIDTGLSGEIAHKMSLMLQKLAEESQIIVITHLPQIAASGNDHMLVYKTSGKDEAYTLLKKLSSEERIDELAKMLSGKEVTAAAVTNAKVLLGIK
ncbi:MAG: hypothetical protein CVU05_14415 [Bacteroidetes bacterium HGW-Bacteroidetes-21]|nr:MAG: hypothetical protein CVU05_14415 [Bacteroidetes bacterium HGW-Bacteroidetes-21]